MSIEPDVRKDTNFPDVQLPPGHIWKYVKQIGSGGGGTAHLWVRLDAEQRIVERIVIKNTVTVDPAYHMIKDGPHEGEWLEVSIQQRLAPSGSTESYTVPVLAAQKIPGSTYGWRTYMPFYSKGDFEKVIKDHYVVYPLPEPSLWFVFRRMAKAAVAMDETFREEGSDRPVVVHQDIKPENIFMAHPGSLGRDEPYPVYPVAYLGDFGLSYLTPDDESWRNRLAGTPGYCAPEHDLGLPPRPRAGYDVPPESKTNVWGVGNCILLAMTGNRGGKHGTDGYKYEIHHKWEYLIEIEGQWSGYSDDLIKTVEWCVKDKMENRPTPQELLEQIERLMPQHTDGMDNWGTYSWVKEKSREIDGPLSPIDAEGAEDADVGTGSEPGEKRKASSPPLSPQAAKRSKAQTSLERRLTYVATIIKGDLPELHEDDQAFTLSSQKALRYSSYDVAFDPETFFDAPGPEPISFFELEAVAADGPDKEGKAREASDPLEDNGDDDEEEHTKSKSKPSRPADEDFPTTADGYDDDDEGDFTKPTGAFKSGSKGGKEKVAAIDEEYGDDDGEGGFYAGGGGTFGGDDDEEDYSKYKSAGPSKIDKGKGKAVDAAPPAAPPVTPLKAKKIKGTGTAMEPIDVFTPSPPKPKGSKGAVVTDDFIDLATPTPVKPKGKGAGTAKSPITFDSPTPVKKKGSAKSPASVPPPVTPPPAVKDKGTKEAPLTVGDTPAPADEDDEDEGVEPEGKPKHHSSPSGGKGKTKKEN
ncbi:kinase-like protein, partial [Aureobasidium melanogenum]